jgi:hypothetical protein
VSQRSHSPGAGKTPKGTNSEEEGFWWRKGRHPKAVPKIAGPMGPQTEGSRSDVLKGLRIHPFEEGESPTWAFVLVKMDGPEEEGWSFRTTGLPNKEELLGALEVQVALLKKSLVKEWAD